MFHRSMRSDDRFQSGITWGKARSRGRTEQGVSDKMKVRSGESVTPEDTNQAANNTAHAASASGEDCTHGGVLSGDTMTKRNPSSSRSHAFVFIKVRHENVCGIKKEGSYHSVLTNNYLLHHSLLH